MDAKWYALRFALVFSQFENFFVLFALSFALVFSQLFMLFSFVCLTECQYSRRIIMANFKLKVLQDYIIEKDYDRKLQKWKPKNQRMKEQEIKTMYSQVSDRHQYCIKHIRPGPEIQEEIESLNLNEFFIYQKCDELDPPGSAARKTNVPSLLTQNYEEYDVPWHPKLLQNGFFEDMPNVDPEKELLCSDDEHPNYVAYLKKVKKDNTAKENRKNGNNKKKSTFISLMFVLLELYFIFEIE